MAIKRSLVVLVHDDGYGDRLIQHLNDAIGGRDMRAESVVDDDLLNAAKQAYAALVGAHARDDSVQGVAKIRLGRALGYLKRTADAHGVCDECSNVATRHRTDAAGFEHLFCEKHWEALRKVVNGMSSQIIGDDIRG